MDWSVNVADHLLRDSALLRVGAEGLGAVVRAKHGFIEVSPMNLEEQTPSG
jgi:hypothetical protein